MGQTELWARRQYMFKHKLKNIFIEVLTILSGRCTRNLNHILLSGCMRYLHPKKEYLHSRENTLLSKLLNMFSKNLYEISTF